MGAIDDHVRFCGGSPDDIVKERSTADGRAITLIFPQGRDMSDHRWVQDGAQDINWLTWNTYGHLCQPGYNRGLRFARDWYLREHGTRPPRGNRYEFPQDVDEFKVWNQRHHIIMPD